jgi:RNA polymerase sigma-70 factor (ECF subfamily)
MDADAKRSLHEHLLALRDGDRRAAEPVFAALWPVCVGLARAALGNEADANDAAQQGLVKLFAGVSAFDASRSGLGWAIALVTWECRTIRRQRSRRRESGADDVVATTAAAGFDVDVALDRGEDVARVVGALVQLDARDQATLRACLDGDAAGDPASRKRRQRAIERLKALVFGAKPASAELPVNVNGDDHV